MQQTCSRCGFVATTPSKFCRQCGAALFNESESSEAATRNYGRQTPAPETPPTSHPFTSPTPQPPPSLADAFAADTSRLHNQPQMAYGQPPLPAAMPPGYPAYPMQQQPKSNWWKWLLGFALMTVLVCGGLLSFAFFRANQIGQQIRREINNSGVPGGVPGGIPGGVPDGAPAPPLPPPPPGTAPEVEKLIYPGAKITSRVTALGQQVMELNTSDSFDKVKAFYEKELGAPMVESNDDDKSLVFQKQPVMVTIDQNKNGSGQISITIIRSSLIPQLNVPKKSQ